MNKIEFLTELRKKLKYLPPSETENAISYYEEYFADAGEENEQRVIEELGTPSSVASKIIGEFAVNDAEKSRNRGIRPLWIVILTILASPVAFPVAFAVFIVVIAIAVSLFAVLFSLGISAVAVSAGGVVSIFAGIWALAVNLPTGLFFIGYGIFAVSIGIIFVIGIIKLYRITFTGLQKLIGKFLIRRSVK